MPRITIEEAWRRCPEGMVAFDRDLAHLGNVHIWSFEERLDLGQLTFCPEWPPHPYSQNQYGLCVDWRDDKWVVMTEMEWVLDEKEYTLRRSLDPSLPDYWEPRL